MNGIGWRIAKYTVLSAVSIIAVGLAIIGHEFYEKTRPPSDPFSTKIREDSDGKCCVRVPLMPSPLGFETLEIEVSHQLNKAGYKPVDPAWRRYGVDMDKVRLVFTRSSSNLICQISWIVIVGIDDRRSLTFAEGLHNETGCL